MMKPQRKLRIAQVAPLYESVPPKLYGGTERVVSYLTEELVARGHDVTLYASADSVTSADLVACTPRSLRLDETCTSPLVPHLLQLERLLARAPQYDIIHFHCEPLQLPWLRHLRTPAVTTMHGRLDLAHLTPLFEEYAEAALVSISDAQRRPLSWARWAATAYNGIPCDMYRASPRHDGYAVFLGRISPEKRPDRAIDIARRAGVPLVMAAKVDRVDRDYFDRDIRPLLAQPGVDFIGEVGEADKQALLGGARALLFPIDWPEPFGMVMIEAMACGTPTIAYPHGSVPEVITDGKSGFIVSSRAEAAAALVRAADFDRGECRRAFEARFTSAHMAQSYVDVYERLIAEDVQPARALSA
jgi:glycosyltransferase involved in cell wall biosynthesis